MVEPRLHETGAYDWVSDHAVLVYEISLLSRKRRGVERPLPVKLGPKPRKDMAGDPKSAWHQLEVVSGKEEFIAALQASTQRAKADKRSQVEALVPLIRRAGEQAVQLAKSRGGGAGGRADRSCFDDVSEARSWRARLELAQECAQGRKKLDLAEWRALFHSKSGMRKLCPRFYEACGAKVDWRAVLARCRRQLSRAEAFLEKKARKDDSWLAAKCQQIADQVGDGDLSLHVRTIWRLLSDRGDSTKMHALHRGDCKENMQLEVDDPEFLAEAGRIGEAFVAGMDRGSIPDAFRAWIEVFCCKHDEIDGALGEWELRQEFSYDIFERVLKSMQGKAVGAGGLSVELLLASVYEVRWIFFNAILDDVESGCISACWRRVIYVLLRSLLPTTPPSWPNDGRSP